MLRPGGRAVFAEPDWDTLVIDCPDLAVARAYTRFVSDKVIPITATFHDAESADKVLGLHRVTARAVTANYLTEHDAEQWLHHLATEPFFASATLFTVAATANPAG